MAALVHVGNAPAAEDLARLAAVWQQRHLRDYSDHQRAQELICEAAGLRLDFSRQRLDADVLTALLDLAQQCGLAAGRDALLAGEPVNTTEQRAAWHTALRADPPPPAVADAILSARQRIATYVRAVHEGQIRNRAGERYTDVINIGVGGSDLGPRLATAVLASPRGLRPHFCGNLDSAALQRLLATINPRRCLVVVCSKSFTTLETLACAQWLRQWLVAGGGSVEQQFLAVTACADKAQAFGLSTEQIFPMWDWVGGRFSLWSAVGLSTALVAGWEAFEELLAGARSMDRHFAQAPLAQNLPVIWGLIAVWNRNFLDYTTQVTVPYCDALALLPAWMQQLEMESNGKAVDREGRSIQHATAPVHWGGVGTDGQHAYFQLLHQGGQAHPVDFVLPIAVPDAQADMQRQLLASALAQSAALAQGATASTAWAHFSGNRPSSLVLLRSLSAFHLGALLAACEHRCFVAGWLWGINSFDQFGVELGKTLTRQIMAGLAGDDSAWPDALSAAQAKAL